MASVLSVAKYILHKEGEMSAMKLQKLVYYSQAWSLVWDSKPLFPEKIEAWANGPVVPALYNVHKGSFLVDENLFGMAKSDLSESEKDTVNAVLKTYSNKTPAYLSELTHHEDPWKTARMGLAIGERGNREISQASMAEYYESLL